MARYFDYFPVIPYDIAGKQLKNYQSVTNIFFRLRVVRSLINNIGAYYEYVIKDGDTPENLAERVYGDPEAHWVILMANDTVDAGYDWPLNYDEFSKYLAKKYKNQAAASLSISVDIITDRQIIAWTQVNYHHYEEVIQRTESLSGLMTETRFIINKSPYSNTIYYVTGNKKTEIIVPDANGMFYVGNTVNSNNNVFVGTVESYYPSNGYISLTNTTGYFGRNTQILQVGSKTNVGNIAVVLSPSGSLIQDPTIPYNTYDDLAADQYVQTFNMGYATKNSTNTLVNAGRTVYQVTFRDSISYFDYENSINESKRTIKVIKPEYYPQIVEEFNNFTNNVFAPYLRKLSVTL